MEKAAINRIILILPEEREILFQNRRTRRLDLAVRLVEKSQFLVFDPLSHYERPPISGKGCVYLSISWLEMGAGLKKDLLVWRIGTGGSLNAFFFLLIGVLSQRLAMVRKKGGTSTLGERSTMESCMLRKDESLPKRNLLILSRTVGAMIYFTGEGSESRYAWDCISTSIMETGL